MPVRNGALNKLIQPIADIIRRDVITGISFESATEAILEAITKKKLGLAQWAGQIALDALMQADGITQNEVRKEFNLEYIRYVGALKLTSRPLCVHLIRAKPQPVYRLEELDAILQEFAPNGVPSQETTPETADGKEQKKGNGIIYGTDMENFLVYRGGYRCEHEEIPARRPPREMIATVEEERPTDIIEG